MQDKSSKILHFARLDNVPDHHRLGRRKYYSSYIKWILECSLNSTAIYEALLYNNAVSFKMFD